jgi:small conductance mechanosensitive channel
MSLRSRTFSKQRFGLIVSMLLGLAFSSVVAAQVNPEESFPTEPFPEEIHPPVTVAIQLLDELSAQFSALELDRDLVISAQGEREQAALFRYDERALSLLSTFSRVAQSIVENEAAQIDRGELAARLAMHNIPLDQALTARLAEIEARIDEGLARLESLSGEDKVIARAQVSSLDNQRLRYLELIIDIVSIRDQLKFPKQTIEKLARSSLSAYSEELVGMIEFHQATRKALKGQLTRSPDNAELKSAIATQTVLIERALQRLERVVVQLERLDLETADQRRLLLAHAKGVSVSLVDADLLATLFDDFSQRFEQWLSSQALDITSQVALFLGILFSARLLARFARAAVHRTLLSRGENISILLKDVLVSMTGATIVALGFFLALAQIGVSVAPMLAGLGVAGFIIGFALQDTLGNFAAGAMILAYKPFDTDDYIEVAGVLGTVKSMNMVSTTINTVDNQMLIIPNSKIWGDVIRNYTGQRVRRVDCEFGISYGDSIEKAERILAEVVASIKQVLPSPEPMIRVHRLGDSSVDFVVRPWVKTEDYWETYWALHREVKLRFDAEGISIPFPQRDVHLFERTK